MIWGCFSFKSHVGPLSFHSVLVNKSSLRSNKGCNFVCVWCTFSTLVLFWGQIRVKRGHVAQGVTAVCVPQWAVGVWSGRLMDYSDICFIHSSMALLQQPQCAPQKCSSSHLEARLPINKMVTVQNPDKVWMQFISWTWQMGRKRGET